MQCTLDRVKKERLAVLEVNVNDAQCRKYSMKEIDYLDRN